MSHLLYRLGRTCYRGAGAVLALWLLVLTTSSASLLLVGTSLDSGFSIPGTPAQVALDNLKRTFPQTAGGAAQVVVHLDSAAMAPAPSPDAERNGHSEPVRAVTDQPVRGEVVAALQHMANIEGVASVTNPYTGERVTAGGADASQVPPQPDVVDTSRVSPDASTLYAQVQFEAPASDVSDADGEEMVQAAADLDDMEGVTVEFGGEAFREGGLHLSVVEVVGLFAALLVLTVAFRSFVTAWVPLVTAVVGVGVAMTLFLVSANFLTVSSSAPTLGLMIGLAVGIDYALFIVSRYRELLATGTAREEAAARATATAGGAVVFAGGTVVIALAGLAVARIPFLTVMGIGAAFCVVVAVAVALTLVPALLRLLGRRIQPPREMPRRSGASAGRAHRWVQFLVGRRLPVVMAVVGLLLLAAVPALDLRLALPDNGEQPEDSTQREAYELIAEEFGPGYNGPLTVTADILQSAKPLETIDALAEDLADVDGVAEITAAIPNQGADTAVFAVVPSGAPDSDETRDLVLGLREASDDLAEKHGTEIAVTGPTAVSIDTSDRLADALIPFGCVVVGLSLLLLALVFRSITVPLTASLGYLLSVGASFGAVAAVFGWGWMAEWIDVADVGPVVSFLPIMLMGVLFGLAMDYQVFLVSRMREAFVHGADAGAAIGTGFRQAGGVVVAAAVIMTAVFAAFVPTGDPVLKPIAFALAVGVAVDAFVVRMTLVPALMAMLGKRAWVLPKWLDHRLPELDVEGTTLNERLEPSDPECDSQVALCATQLELRVEDGLLVEQIDLSVNYGDLAALIGPARATRGLLLCFAGRMRPSHGTVRLLGRGLGQVGGAITRGELALVDVTGVLPGDLTTHQMDVAEPRFAHGLAVLNAVLPDSAPQGESRRWPLLPTNLALADHNILDRLLIGLAFALGSDPELLLVAVPDLDEDSSAVLWALLQQLSERGVTVLTATRTAPPFVTVIDLTGFTGREPVSASATTEQLP